MELALHLGMPVEMMLRSMDEVEFQGWDRYAAKRGLPQRRIEIYLAQIAHVIAVTMGGSKSKLNDWMLREPGALPDNVTRIEEARKAFNFNPRKKKV